MSTLLQCQSTSGNRLISHTPGIVTLTTAVATRLNKLMDFAGTDRASQTPKYPFPAKLKPIENDD